MAGTMEQRLQQILNICAKQFEGYLKKNTELNLLLAPDETISCVLFVRREREPFTSLEWELLFSIPWNEQQRQALELLRERQPRREKELSTILRREVTYQMRDQMNCKIRARRLPFLITTRGNRDTGPGWLVARKFRTTKG